MKYVCAENSCAGCMACVNACAKKAINIVDSLIAYNAVIDEKLCVNCGNCLRVCPNNSEVDLHSPIFWKEGWANETGIRKGGSSGGIASAIIAAFINKGGSVCSCVFQEGQFAFEIVTEPEAAKAFSGSKYVKSNPGLVYRHLKSLLNNKTPVLFIGLPCQVAGLKNYIGKECESLYTIDLICHGTPSPMLLKSYLSDDLGIDYDNVDSIGFRDKNTFRLYVSNKGVLPYRVIDCYTHAFLEGLSYTENCFRCRYANIERVSDLTLGDSWGSELPDDEKTKGVSLVLCMNDKGKYLLDISDLVLCDIDLEISKNHNQQLLHPSIVPDSRQAFINKLKKTNSVKKAVSCTSPYFFFKQNIKEFLIKLHILKDSV